jgi:hypothetical protein
VALKFRVEIAPLGQAAPQVLHPLHRTWLTRDTLLTSSKKIAPYGHRALQTLHPEHTFSLTEATIAPASILPRVIIAKERAAAAEA